MVNMELIFNRQKIQCAILKYFIELFLLFSTLHAIEQKRLGESCICILLPQASHSTQRSFDLNALVVLY